MANEEDPWDQLSDICQLSDSDLRGGANVEEAAASTAQSGVSTAGHAEWESRLGSGPGSSLADGEGSQLDADGTSDDQPSAQDKKPRSKDSKRLRMSRRREINNNAQRRFRQRQRDRLQTLEDKLADATRRMEGMKLQMANQETQLQRYSDTQMSAGTLLAGPSDPALSLAGDIQMTFNLDQPRMMTVNDMKFLTVPTWAKVWKEYVNALAGCMAEMPPGVQTTTPRMEQLLKEANSLIAGLVHVNPRTLREWHVLTNMESQDEGYAGPSKETLEAVVKAVNCTRAQVEDGLALRKAYLLRSQQIIRRRQELSVQLQHADFQPGITTSQSGRVFIVASELSRQLRHLIEEEHKCFATFMACISHGMLTSIQNVEGIVQTYPAAPDTMSYLAFQAEQIQAPTAEEILASNATDESIDEQWQRLVAYAHSLRPEDAHRHVPYLDQSQ